MPKKPFLEAGRIVGTHGVRGEVRLLPWTDTPGTLTPLKTLYFDEGRTPVRVSCRPHKNLVLVTIEGITTVEAAAALRDRVLYLNRQDLPLPRGRYFVQDLIGMAVVDDTTGVRYGTVTDVSDTGANNVYHLDYGGREVLIPAIPDVVRAVDSERDEVRIVPLKGLFDDAD